MAPEAKRIYLTGIVQGVGFRPFVFKLAREMGFQGWVINSGLGVTIHAEGEGLALFIERLQTETPPLARIDSSRLEDAPFANHSVFRILESQTGSEQRALISPDIATCSDCLKDMAEPGNRRYRYAFTNCTNCGPRYTIIQGVPYDRIQTTMAGFVMCEDCALEYGDPLNRRFHAQPIACHTCGPQVELRDGQGNRLPGYGVQELNQGGILAVKGLGGYHLVCDARKKEAVDRLRSRKERGAKPFALMARSPAAVRREMELSSEEEDWLLSPAAPIVILRRRCQGTTPLPEGIAPGLSTLGVMVPYTPLHHLLFEGPYDFLVMTSANLSGRPLIYRDEEALEGLQGIADFFLIHNRPIYHPCDDSVVQLIGGEGVFLRRARGYVPLPLQLPGHRFKSPFLGVGGELKNAFCLAAEEQAFVSQYLGDMEGYENLNRFHQELESFQRVVKITPEVLAYDKHPNYQLTRYALEQERPKLAVQHHHAHLVSVLGEWGRTEPTLGIICDGTGMGDDGRIWGFELLYGNAAGYERRGHLEYLPLPGGDGGAKHPLRIAYAYLKTLLDAAEFQQTEAFWEALSSQELRILDRQLETGVQIFPTSSAGRLFDAVSALLGVCRQVTYEGQGAIELENAAEVFAWRSREQPEPYPFPVCRDNSALILKAGPLCRGIVADMINGRSPGEIAWRFHLSVAYAIVDLAEQAGSGEGPLVLSGGVFQNRLLTEAVLELCRGRGIQTLRSRTLPPGDGGLAFGQVLIANEVL